MINKDEATIAMINVSRGVANNEEKLLVETMDERLFSEIYEELRILSTDTNYAIEDYYEVEEDETESVIPVEDTTKLKWGLDDEEVEEEDLDSEDSTDKNKLIGLEFKDFLTEFGEDYETEEEAHKDFIENYCSFTTESRYSDNDLELESMIVDEFSEFLISNGNNYQDSEDAYDDYMRNHCSYL